MRHETAVDLVKTFLRTMEARDLENADKMMAPGAKITFPGGKEYSSQREMVEVSRGRYQWIKKTFDQIDAYSSDDAHIVYVMGTLTGVNRHGVSFSGVRYIDRFEIRNDLISRQDVWNDLAETGALEKLA